MFMELGGKKIVERDNLSAALTDANKVKIDLQKGSGAKDNSGHFPVPNLPFQ